MKGKEPALASSYGSKVLAAVRLTAFLTLFFGMIPIHVAVAFANPRHATRLPMIFHRLLLKIIGFKVQVHGALASGGPVLFVANHASYLDIPVLGALIPGSFVAKAEVASWPLFGFMAKLQNTVFIERRARHVDQQRQTLISHLSQGHNLILFPEGTSTDGQRVLPFKSSLFSAIEDAAADLDILVQPVSITCTALDNLPMTQSLRHMYGWYGDLELVPHLWQALKCSRFTVDVIFHPPLHARDIPDRKRLAQHCYQLVASGVEQSIRGRPAHIPSQPLLKSHSASSSHSH
jgi:1-acyl-sn-glycerol-3-phosphate acyltransferase